MQKSSCARASVRTREFLIPECSMLDEGVISRACPLLACRAGYIGGVGALFVLHPENCGADCLPKTCRRAIRASNEPSQLKLSKFDLTELDREKYRLGLLSSTMSTDARG